MKESVCSRYQKARFESRMHHAYPAHNRNATSPSELHAPANVTTYLSVRILAKFTCMLTSARLSHVFAPPEYSTPARPTQRTCLKKREMPMPTLAPARHRSTLHDARTQHSSSSQQQEQPKSRARRESKPRSARQARLAGSGTLFRFQKFARIRAFRMGDQQADFDPEMAAHLILRLFRCSLGLIGSCRGPISGCRSWNHLLVHGLR